MFLLRTFIFIILLFPFSKNTLAIGATGAKSCAVCHSKIHNEWQKSKHAKAFSLVPKGHPKNQSCKDCHNPVLFRSQLKANEGISCEHCHGNGNFYHHKFIMKDKQAAKLSGLQDPKTQCLKCHQSSPFHLKKVELEELFKKLKVHSFKSDTEKENKKTPEKKAEKGPKK